MLFDRPVVSGVLIKRYKRFLADVQLASGEMVVAHVPNSGSMLGVSTPGSACRLLLHQNTNRKLSYTLVQVQSESKTWVGVDTSLPNRLVDEALKSGRFEFWSEFPMHFREVKISAESRIDFFLARTAVERKQLAAFIAQPKGQGSMFLEIKNVSMSLPPAAVFPDAKTERGQKHLRELMSLTQKGFRTEMVFVIQRDDCKYFSPCDAIDPEYGKMLRKAVQAGVIVRAIACVVDDTGVSLDRIVPAQL